MNSAEPRTLQLPAPHAVAVAGVADSTQVATGDRQHFGNPTQNKHVNIINNKKPK